MCLWIAEEGFVQSWNYYDFDLLSQRCDHGSKGAASGPKHELSWLTSTAKGSVMQEDDDGEDEARELQSHESVFDKWQIKQIGDDEMKCKVLCLDVLWAWGHVLKQSFKVDVSVHAGREAKGVKLYLDACCRQLKRFFRAYSLYRWTFLCNFDKT